MIDPSILRGVRRIRRRYAEAFAALPHTRTAPENGTRAPHALAYSLSDALREVRSEIRAWHAGLTCTIDADDLPWDVDAACPAPRHVLCAIVRDSDGRILASLGGIGVDSLDDPYLDTCTADLYADALDDIAAAAAIESTHAAIALASRATYAGPSPEVQP